MRQLRDVVVTLGSRLNPNLSAILAVALNVYWLVILTVINQEFQVVTNGYPLLDLQNSLSPGEIITPAKVLEHLGDYTQASKFICWIFFMLDNIMPQLAFGSIALLWVYFWRSNPNRLYNWLLGGYAVLIPLGVGVFDWLEWSGWGFSKPTWAVVMLVVASAIGLFARFTLCRVGCSCGHSQASRSRRGSRSRWSSPLLYWRCSS